MSDLPSPPFINVPGVSNFRDIGGQLTSDGHTVRNGLVYRSADPSKATTDGMKIMADKGIRTIFDLRSTPEIQRDGPEWAGLEVALGDFTAYDIERLWTPVFADIDYGPEQVAVRYKDYTTWGTEGFVKAYRDILQSGNEAYEKIFRHLAKVDTTPCLINCTAGKDRTGIAIALLLTLVGVSADSTSEEYALTDLGLADLKPMFVERLSKNPALEGNLEGVWRMVSSKKENMQAALEMIESHFGGVEQYMRQNCRLTDVEISQIKKNLLEGRS